MTDATSGYTEPVSTLDELREKAMALPAPERAKLAVELLESLDEPDREELDQEKIERAWDDEIHRRCEEIDSGQADLITEDEFWNLLRD